MGDKSVSGMLYKVKPYLAMVSLQFGYAGMYIITMVSLNHGMSHYILAMYRHVVATIILAPFALVLERPVIDQNLYFVGMKYTSATFASAVVNVLPAITFIMAIIFRLETVKIKQLPSQAKIIGTVVTVGGAMVMTLYKGPIINIISSRGGIHHGTTNSASSDQHWVTGTLMVIASCFGWSGFFILQSFTLKEYPAQLSLASLICFMGTILGAAVALVMEHDMSVWKLGWDSTLLAPVYSGVVCSAIAYYVQGNVNKERGPVFVTAFSPLCMIITAALGSFILAEQIHLGSIIGAIFIVIGLYSVAWGKSKDVNSTPMENDKCGTSELPITNFNETGGHAGMSNFPTKNPAQSYV